MRNTKKSMKLFRRTPKNFYQNQLKMNQNFMMDRFCFYGLKALLSEIINDYLKCNELTLPLTHVNAINKNIPNKSHLNSKENIVHFLSIKYKLEQNKLIIINDH